MCTWPRNQPPRFVLLECLLEPICCVLPFSEDHSPEKDASKRQKQFVFLNVVNFSLNQSGLVLSFFSSQCFSQRHRSPVWFCLKKLEMHTVPYRKNKGKRETNPPPLPTGHTATFPPCWLAPLPDLRIFLLSKDPNFPCFLFSPCLAPATNLFFTFSLHFCFLSF